MLEPQRLMAAAVLLALVAFLVLRVRRPRVPIWSFMAFLAFISVAAGLVPLDEIGNAVNYDVIFFLIGMFSLVSAAETSGLLSYLAYRFIRYFRSARAALIASSFLFGLLAAVAVNDTVALIGTPVAIAISEAAGVDAEAAILLLAFSLTVGSVATPMGNPQNMLIAVESGVRAPLITFVRYLMPPTLLNLLIVPLVVMAFYRAGGGAIGPIGAEARITNRRDAAVSAIGLAATLAALVVNDYMELRGLPHVQNIGFIPFIAAAGTYMALSDPRERIKGVDWGTIIFFITMFITMYGVWRSGLFSEIVGLLMPSRTGGLLGIIQISAISIALSQVLSNVPFVNLFISYMDQLGYSGASAWPWLALAYSSTVAGNLTLFGAASNIIILEALESRYGRTISFTRFLEVGAVITAINFATYSAFLYLSFFGRGGA